MEGGRKGGREGRGEEGSSGSEACSGSRIIRVLLFDGLDELSMAVREGGREGGKEHTFLGRRRRRSPRGR